MKGALNRSGKTLHYTLQIYPAPHLPQGGNMCDRPVCLRVQWLPVCLQVQINGCYLGVPLMTLVLSLTSMEMTFEASVMRGHCSPRYIV